MLADNDVQAVRRLNEAYRAITDELGKVIIGQRHVIEELMIAMFAGGHCLLVGVPGLAKTLDDPHAGRCAVARLQPHSVHARPDAERHHRHGSNPGRQSERACVISSSFPDRSLRMCILADEINRTPPKTQAALLEAMQEHQITVGGQKHRLPEPFFVLATQNPIEQEGTYPLPEAQLDRFMFNIYVDYPSEDEEFQIVKRTTADVPLQVSHTLAAEEILGARSDRPPRADRGSRDPLRAKVHAAHAEGKGKRPRLRSRLHQLGRRTAGQPISGVGRKARAVLHGRYMATTEDVRAVALPVLRHRIMTNFNAEAEGIKPDEIVRRLIDCIPDRRNREQRWKNSRSISIRKRWLGLRASSCGRAPSWKGTSRACTAVPTTAFPIEFAEHREYVPGDDTRYIDWKVFGKTDKFYLKQYEQETNLITLSLARHQRKHALPGAAVGDEQA